MDLYFSDAFGVSDKVLANYGAFNISLVTDLPLFIDPFLLFNSSKPVYRQLHDEMIRYLKFLRAKSGSGGIDRSLIKAWYLFSEVRQTWLGFCRDGNRGRGLGRDFATALDRNLVDVFRDFGRERITRGSHIEKLCLIGAGVGRDMISDFTTNLIKKHLLEYTQRFARRYIASDRRRPFAVRRVTFSYELECWRPGTYELPVFEDDYVILTPKDILTKDDTWISHNDMIHRFQDIPDSVEDDQLRAEINNYFLSALGLYTKPSVEDYRRSVSATLARFPVIIDHYIRMKEDEGDQAVTNSEARVSDSHQLYVQQFGQLVSLIHELTEFYDIPGNTRQEARQKIEFFKDVIENKGGYRLFYVRGEPVRTEQDVQILFRLVWHRSPSDVSREVNDGRGPADYKISRGAADKTIVEFKLASNTQLRRNLRKQAETYQKASDAGSALKVVIYFSEAERLKVVGLLEELGLLSSRDIILVDARRDNKPSGSKA